MRRGRDGMKKAVRLMILNEIRQSAKLFKHYGILFLIISAVIAAVSYSYTGEILFCLRERYVATEFVIGTALGGLFLFKKNPPILISSATIYYLKDVGLINLVFLFKLISKAILLLFISAIICFLCSDKLSVFFFINVFTTLAVRELSIWNKYQKLLPIFEAAAVCFASIAMMIFPIKTVGIVLNAFFIFILSENARNFSWDNYYRDMKYYDRVKACAARNDIAGMMIIACESGARDKYAVPFKNLKGIHPLLVKSIVIDAFREPRPILLLKGTALCAAIISFNLPLETLYKNIIFIGFAAYLITAIIKTSSQAAASLISKCGYGLFIPVPLWKTAACHAVSPIAQITFIWALFAAFCTGAGIGIVFIYALQCGAVFIWIRFALSFVDRQKITDIAGSIFIAATLTAAAVWL